MEQFPSLGRYMAHLVTAEIVPLPNGETWDSMIARIHVTGTHAEIDQDTWDWFLECLPPKYMGSGFFAFAEGAEPLKVFWKRGGRFFVRPLTWDETTEFCRLAGIPLPH